MIRRCRSGSLPTGACNGVVFGVSVRDSGHDRRETISPGRSLCWLSRESQQPTRCGRSWHLAKPGAWARYLSFFLRLIVAALGFWFLLAVTPSLVALSGPHEWIGAGALAVVLLAWNAAYSTVFHAVLRARPVDDPVLVARFARMLNKCGLPAVALEQVDVREACSPTPWQCPRRDIQWSW